MLQEALIDINPQLRLGDSRSSSTIQHMEQHHMQALNIDTIEHLMDKVTYLLDIGFGEAGQQIIAACLSGPDGEFNATMPGIHVTAVFGFCDIRRFTDATEVLRADVMPFVNLVADIVHGATVKHNGAPNKNIGDAFLCVWKTEMYAAGTAGPTTADATPVHDTFGETQRIGNARSKKGLNKMEAGSTYSPIPGEGSGRRSRRGSGGATRFRSLEKPIEGSTGSSKRELRRGSVPMIVGLGERSLQEIYSDACDSALKAFVEVITEIDSPKTSTPPESPPCPWLLFNHASPSVVRPAPPTHSTQTAAPRPPSAISQAAARPGALPAAAPEVRRLQARPRPRMLNTGGP